MKRIVCKKADIGRGPLILVNSANPLRNAGVSLIPLELTSQGGGESIYLERRAANLLTACIRAEGHRARLRLEEPPGAAANLGRHPEVRRRGVHPEIRRPAGLQRAPDRACHRPGAGGGAH